jgi:hypothetical protein
MPQRLSKKNAVLHEDTTLEASSEETGFPVEALQDQQRQDFWRSAQGWTIVTGWNDRIDFDRGGVKVATATSGHYATAGLYAAAWVAAFEAADSTPAWAVGYNSVTGIFTISTAAHSFSLLLSSGANVLTRSGHLDLGLEDNVDTPPATSVVGVTAVYQSKHRIRLEVPAEARPDGITVVAVLEHNFSTDTQAHDIILRQFSDSGYSVFVGSTDLTNVNPDDTLGVRRSYIEDENVSYLELEIADRSNPDGYGELGVLWLGSYVEFTDRLDRSVTDDPEDFSRIEQGPDGTVYVDFGRNRSRLGLQWRPLADDELDAMLDFLRDLSAGEAWLLDLDSGEFESKLTFYGAFFQRPKKVHLSKTPTVEVAIVTFEFVVYL